MDDVTTDQAARFAQAYVELVEALMRQGVPEAVARLEARSVAYMIVFEDLLDGLTDREPWED